MEDQRYMKTGPAGAAKFDQWADCPLKSYTSKQHKNVKSRYAEPKAGATQSRDHRKVGVDDVKFDESNVVVLDKNDPQRSIVLKYGVPTLKTAMAKLTLHYDLRSARRKLLPIQEYMYLEMVEDGQYFAASVLEYLMVVDAQRTTEARLAPALRSNDNLLIHLGDRLKAADHPESDRSHKALALLRLAVMLAGQSTDWRWIAEHCLLIASTFANGTGEPLEAYVLFVTGWFFMKTVDAPWLDAARYFNCSRNLAWNKDWRLPVEIREIFKDNVDPEIADGPLWAAACYNEYSTLMALTEFLTPTGVLRAVETALQLVTISGPQSHRYAIAFELGKCYHAIGMSDKATETLLDCAAACKGGVYKPDPDLDLKALLEAGKIFHQTGRQQEAYELLESLAEASRIRRNAAILVAAIVEIGRVSIKMGLEDKAFFNLSLAHALLAKGMGRQLFDADDMLAIDMHAAACRANSFLTASFQTVRDNHFNLSELTGWWKGKQPLIVWHGDRMTINAENVDDNVVAATANKIERYLNGDDDDDVGCSKPEEKSVAEQHQVTVELDERIPSVVKAKPKRIRIMSD